MHAYPPFLDVVPRGPVDATLAVPGSKSLTNRALVVAALSDGLTRLEGALVAEDSSVMLRALDALGFETHADGATFSVVGRGGRVPAREATLDLRLSGTSIRFLTAMLAAAQGRFVLDGNDRMRQRPIRDLLDALEALGAHARSVNDDGCPPVVLESRGLEGGRTSVRGDASSQYLSGLLLAAPYARGGVEIGVTGELQSKPFVDMTIDLMRDFGVRVERDGYDTFRVEPAVYAARDPYAIEGDAMAAGYLWAAAAITGGRALVTNVGERSKQGDRRLADVLERMGCTVTRTEGTTEVAGPAEGRLRGGEFDLNDMPDQAQTLGVIALFADRPVTITNVWNMRIKETDRLTAMRVELERFGAQVIERHDSLTVHPLERMPSGRVDVETYGDHRMAMAFALAGLRIPGVRILEPACVAKTYPEFFEALAAL